MCNSGGVDFSDKLQTVVLMTATMELALSALVLWLLAVLDAMPIRSTVEALVALWGGRASFTLLLLVIP